VHRLAYNDDIVAFKMGRRPFFTGNGMVESMDKGELNNTVFQDLVAQGEEAVNAAYLMVKKQPNSKIENGNIWIPYQKITKENYKSFMK